MKNLSTVCAFVTLLLFFTSCSEENKEPEVPLGDYEYGYFVSNEGPFQNGSGSITFVGQDGSVEQNIYKKVNGQDLGNIVNSMQIVDDKAYIVVNNSNKIVVANRYTMQSQASIVGENIKSPRYFAASNGKGFISNWGDPFDPLDDFITVISLESNTVLTTISVGEGPEKMLIEGEDLFVCLQGGYGTNNKVVVIDIFDLNIKATLSVGDVPNSIVADGNGEVRVLCGGNPDWTGNETMGMLYRIIPRNYDVSSIDFSDTDHPGLLSWDMGKLYYSLNGEVYEMAEDDENLPGSSIDGLDGFFYSMTVQNGELYATDAADFVSEGTLRVFNVNSGALLESIPTGIVPGQVVFP